MAHPDLLAQLLRDALPPSPSEPRPSLQPEGLSLVHTRDRHEAADTRSLFQRGAHLAVAGRQFQGCGR